MGLLLCALPGLSAVLTVPTRSLAGFSRGGEQPDALNTGHLINFRAGTHVGAVT